MRNSESIKTIFYQGIYNSQVQLSKYLGTEGFIATTGERIVCEKGLPLILNPFIGKEIDEIEPFQNSISNWLNPLKLFSYLFAYIGHICNGISVLTETSKDKDSRKDQGSLITHYINLPKFNFGQDGDLANHYYKYIQCVSENLNDNLILWGVSKGAATTLNSLTKNNYDTSRIKLVVLEGCFTSIEDVFKHWVEHRSYFDSNYILARLFLWLLSKDLLKYIVSYESKREHDPINIVDSLPHNIPIAFITCDVDIVVPASQTIALYEKVKATGHPNVHLLQLKNSRHHAYMFDDENDRNAYKTFINDLYNKYISVIPD